MFAIQVYKWGKLMKIAVSACLLGENCKYNGGNNYSSTLVKILESHQVIPICPEALGGLPSPRDPAEIVGSEVLTKDGRSVDKEFRRGAEKALEIVKEFGADLVVLQARSPSCGVGKVYDGSFSGKLIKGDGIFVKALKKEEIKALNLEDFLESYQKVLSSNQSYLESSKKIDI